MPRANLVWHHPTALELQYGRAIKRLANQCGKACDRYVIPEIDGIVEEAQRYRPDALGDQSEGDGWVARLNRALRRMLSSLLGGAIGGPVDLESITEQQDAVTVQSVPIVQIAEQVSDFNRRQFHRSMRKAYGIDITKREPWLRSELAAWESRNLSLIRSIPEQYVDRLQGQIVQAVQQGRTSKQVQALIRETYDVPKKRAALIADDQIGKLNGNLTQLRQRSIGVKEYQWRGVLDSRERPEHRAREGQIFKWNSPPSDGHPGESIRCRCSAEAVLPELEDLDLS